jgi:hypothetical protein
MIYIKERLVVHVVNSSLTIGYKNVKGTPGRFLMRLKAKPRYFPVKFFKNGDSMQI